jgi:uracil-DNA glycosylase
MSSELEQILTNVSAYLQYQIDDGHRASDLSPERLALLSTPRVTSGSPSLAPSAAAGDSISQPGQESVPSALRRIATAIDSCRRCDLGSTRRRAVPGQGAEQPEIMFIGEAPGEDEDRQGLAFVGAAGQLLTKMIAAMGFRREDVFIANILKCRPPGNRTPQPDEMDRCIPFIKEQIAILKPRVIIVLGGTALRGLLRTDVGITRMRGCWQSLEGIDVMPTFHPSFLLRNPAAKKEVWEDLQAVLRHLGKPIPDHRKRDAKPQEDSPENASQG